MSNNWQSNKIGYDDSIYQNFRSQPKDRNIQNYRATAGTSFQPYVQNLVNDDQHMRISQKINEFSNSNQVTSFEVDAPKHFISTSAPQSSQSYTNTTSHFTNLDNNLSFSSKMNQQDDALFVKAWLKNIENLIMDKKSKAKSKKFGTSRVKISDVHNAFLASNELSIELEEILSKLTYGNKAEADWINLIQKTEKLKVDLEEMKMFINDAVENGKLKEVIEQRRDKRRRAKIKKKQFKEKYLRMKEQWKEKEKKIDLWLKQTNDNQKTLLQAKSVQKAADSILHEVRTKQEEALEIKNLVAVLQQLREIRLKKGEVHGFVSRKEDNEAFINMAAELNKLINNQLIQYGLEEQTLRVMMENPPSVLPGKTYLPKNPSKNAEDCKKQIYDVLFGKNIPYQKLNESQKFFLAAENSVEMLIKRRTSWDKYLADDVTPASLSASVPLGWIVPPVDPVSQWKKFQSNKRNTN